MSDTINRVILGGIASLALILLGTVADVVGLLLR